MDIRVPEAGFRRFTNLNEIYLISKCLGIMPLVYTMTLAVYTRWKTLGESEGPLVFSRLVLAVVEWTLMFGAGDGRIVS